MKSKFLMGTLALIAAAGAVLAADNFVRTGGYVEYTNPGAAIGSGDVVDLGDRYGVAIVDIASNGTGVVKTEGVWDLPVATNNAVAVLAKLYWDGTYVTDVQTADTFIGIALEAHSAHGGSSPLKIAVDINPALRPTLAAVGTALVIQRGTALNADGVTTNSLVITNVTLTTTSPY